MPEALLKEPQSQITEECIKEIYMDIDNPESDASIETGEIVEDTISSSSKQDKDPEKPIEVNQTNKNADKFDLVSRLNTKSENVQKITIPSEIPEEISIIQQLGVPKDIPKIICDDNLTKMIRKDNQHSSTSQSSLPHFDELETSSPHKNMPRNGTERQSQISLAEMEMVREDLELSDETSDNLDYRRHTVTKKENLCEGQHILKSKKDNDLYNKQSYSFKITPEGSNNLTVEVVNNTPNESLKEYDGHKKQRSKKRKIRYKELDEKNNPITEKKIKSKKDKELKPDEIKNKFSDLFGDSSSLITPLDLGIPSDCVPLCEDAQDAVDINIKEVVAAQSCANVSSGIKPDETIPERHRDGDLNINNKDIAANIEDCDASSKVDCNIIYQNLNSEVDLNKPDIVKTIIISSGVQPPLISESEESPPNRCENVILNKQNNVSFHQVAVDTELKKQTSLKALATSTPHKELPINNAMDPECVIIPSTSGSIDTNKPVANQSNINTQEQLGAPDVRIFVRRRKKGVKKA